MALSQAHLALCLSFPSLSFFIDLTGFYEAPEALQVTVTSFLPSIRQRTLIEHILCACICVERGFHAQEFLWESARYESIYPHDQHLLSTCCVPGPILNPGYNVGHQPDPSSAQNQSGEGTQ